MNSFKIMEMIHYMIMSQRIIMIEEMSVLLNMMKILMMESKL